METWSGARKPYQRYLTLFDRVDLWDAVCAHQVVGHMWGKGFIIS